MLVAYFGGLGADRQSRYELLLEQAGLCFTVTAVDYQRRVQRRLSHYLKLSLPSRQRPAHAHTSQLYQGEDAHVALGILLREARAANLGRNGQRMCYVLPSVPANPCALASLLASHLRYDGSLPIHPQLWQAGSSLETLPVERHAQACMDAHTLRSGASTLRSL